MADFWRNCSSCKKEIPFSTNYYVCSVSTCKQKRNNFAFCSVPCFERHLPGARHKDAWAEEEASPSQAQHQATQQQSSSSEGGRRRIVASKPSPTTSASAALNSEILVVVSKLKNYIKANYDFNTSQDVMAHLSEMIRRECDRAADNARNDGRKTVMARDFK